MNRALRTLACLATLYGSAVLAADVPPATVAQPYRDPYVPPAQREARAVAPLSGPALQDAVDARLRARFDAADVEHVGSITRAQATAAGLGYVARDFDAIDTAGTGRVSYANVRAFLAREAARASTPR
ncbi:MAG: EF-hand domain-containing protein [Proteobacteria bacterium]|nr:EF-hand domain-containing protein [Pseudomonadota bacterium]